jgi:hypothetical protein
LTASDWVRSGKSLYRGRGFTFGAVAKTTNKLAVNSIKKIRYISETTAHVVPSLSLCVDIFLVMLGSE